MKIRHSADTDTLYIEFREAAMLETKVLDENTIMDLDRDGNICAITIEDARERTQYSFVLVRTGARLTLRRGISASDCGRSSRQTGLLQEQLLWFPVWRFSCTTRP